MNKKRINDYLLKTIWNTNPTILNQMLDEYVSTARSCSIEKIADYFYKASFTSLDYGSGLDFLSKYSYITGRCSSTYNGQFYGRNYDWTYDNRVTFFVTCDDGRHYKSMGFSSGPSTLIEGQFAADNWKDEFEIIPFMLLDGINEMGVICNINVVPTGDYGVTTGTNPGKEDLPALMLVRFVLDYADSVDSAIALLNKRNIFCPGGLELHFEIADSTKSAIIEFVNNELKVTYDDTMTNFYLFGFDGTKESLTPFGSGLERYQILKDGKSAVASKDDMLNLMQQVWYTNAYKTSTNPVWFTDFVGHFSDRVITNSTPEDEIMIVVERGREAYNNRSRNGYIWQTVHSAAYDIESKSVSVRVQENASETYTFSLEI